MAIPQFPISFQGTKFICALESFRSLPYKDSGDVWTIGYGTTFPAQDLPQFEKGISQATGMFLFSKHNEVLQKQLSKTPLVGLAQHQLDAIFSLCYNIGFQEFIDSTIYKHLVTRDHDLSPWLWFDLDEHKKKSVGLDRRRKLELRLFLYGNYSIIE